MAFPNGVRLGPFIGAGSLHAPGIDKGSGLIPMAFTIELKLYATLQAYAPADAASYPVEAGTSIGAIVKALNIPRDQVKLVFSNGVRCEPATLVNANDRIGIFPPVGGG